MTVESAERGNVGAGSAPEEVRLSRWERITVGFRALRVRNYRLYWTGQLVSQVGSWAQTTAQAWLVLTLTSSPFAIGLVATLQFMPIMLLTLFGGVIADRVAKHRFLTILQAVALVQTLVFGTLVATGAIQLWHVYILAVWLGIIGALDTPTRQTFAVELVGRDVLVNAVALNSMQFNIARIIGPAIAGVVIARFDIAPVIFLNSLTYGVAIIFLLLMDRSAINAAKPRMEGGVLQPLLEGLRYCVRTPAVLLILIVVGSIGTFGYNFSTVLPLLAGFVLRTEAAEFGALSAFLGIGSLSAAMVTAFSRRVTINRLLGGSAAFGVILGCLAVTPVFEVAAALLVLLGFAGILFATTANTLLQLTVPDELRGRVMSLYFLLFAGSTPIGSFLIGTLSAVIGVSETLLVCAALCVLGVAGAFMYRRAHPEAVSNG
jgi:MFS family permease